MKGLMTKLSLVLFGFLLLSPPLLFAQVIDNSCGILDQSCDDGNPCTQDQCNFRRAVDSIIIFQSTCVSLCNNPPQIVAGGTCSADCQFTPFEIQPIPPRIDFSPCNNNGVLDFGEQCDGENLNGQSCATLFPGQTGLLRCNDNCQFNTANCQNPLSFEVRSPTCGNGTPEGTEGCDDGNNINGDGCNENCILETTATPPPAATGGCVSSTTCNDNNACTVDLCLPSGQVVPGGASPNVCSNLPVNPDDSNSCTTDSCDPAAGVQHAAIPNCPPATCGNGALDSGEDCDFAADGVDPETCDQNCKRIEPIIVAACRCDDPEDRVTKGACTEGGIECCIPIKKNGQRSTFTCDFNLQGGGQAASLSLRQRLLTNATVLWTQTGGTNTIKAVTGSPGAETRREGAVVLQSISVPTGAEGTSIKAFAPIPVGDGKNFETYQLSVVATSQNGALVTTPATANINTAVEVSGGGKSILGGCSLIR